MIGNILFSFGNGRILRNILISFKSLITRVKSVTKLPKKCGQALLLPTLLLATAALHQSRKCFKKNSFHLCSRKEISYITKVIYLFKFFKKVLTKTQ